MGCEKTKFRVHTSNMHLVVVEADYCEAKRDGRLVFKDLRSGTFALRVTEFASGAWLYYEVCKKETDNAEV